MALIKKLKPCPLCGASNELLKIALPAEEGEMGIMCTWCENYISVKGDPETITLNDVIERWNTQVGEARTIKPSGLYHLDLNRVQEIAFKKGWSVSRLCEEAGMSRSRATRWRHGYSIQAGSVYKLAEALGCESKDIVLDF